MKKNFFPNVGQFLEVCDARRGDLRLLAQQSFVCYITSDDSQNIFVDNDVVAIDTIIDALEKAAHERTAHDSVHSISHQQASILVEAIEKQLKTKNMFIPVRWTLQGWSFF